MATQIDLEETVPAGSVEDPIRGDAFLAEAAEKLGESLMCKKCGMEVAPDDAVKKTIYTVWCKRCNKSWMMLHRSMSWPPADFSSMTAEDQMSFWKACREEVELDAKGRLVYSSLRAQLVKTLTQRRISQNSAEEKTIPMPLEAWKKAGWDADHIEKNGKKVWSEQAGWLYEVTTVNKAKSVIMQEIDSRLTKSEQSIKEMKSSDAAGAVGLESADEDELEKEEPPAKKARGNGGKAKAEKPGKAEALQRRKQEAEDRKHNTKMQMLATKAVSYLQQLHGDCKQAKQVVEQNVASYPLNIAEDTLEAAKKIEEMYSSANNVLKLAPSSAAKGTRLPDLGYEAKEKVRSAGQAKASLRTFTAISKALKIGS